MQPWLVRLSGLSTGLRTKGSLVHFPVRAHAWVAVQVPHTGCMGGNHTLMFLSLSLSPFLSLSLKNKEMKSVKKKKKKKKQVPGSHPRPCQSRIWRQ